MRKISTFCCIFIFCLGTSGLAQIGPPGSVASKNRDDNKEIMNQFLKGIKKNTDLSDNIDGSPYLVEGFQPALLVFPENDPLSAEVRYNVAKEEMQVSFDDDSYRALHPGVVVKFNGVPFRMFTYRGDEANIDLLGYFEILTPDYTNKDLILLRKHKKDVRRGRAAAAMQQATPPRYVDKDDFYIKFQDSNPVLVERSTKKFIDLFPEEHQEEVKDYMKENKLKSRNEQDLKSIVNFYNSRF